MSLPLTAPVNVKLPKTNNSNIEKLHHAVFSGKLQKLRDIALNTEGTFKCMTYCILYYSTLNLHTVYVLTSTVCNKYKKSITKFTVLISHTYFFKDSQLMLIMKTDKLPFFVLHIKEKPR